MALFPAGTRDFFFSETSAPALGSTQPPANTEALAPELKRPGREVNHSSSSKAQVKTE